MRRESQWIWEHPAAGGSIRVRAGRDGRLSEHSGSARKQIVLQPL